MIPYLVVMALIPAFACALKPLRSKDKRITLTWIFYGMLAFLAMVRKETVGVDTPQFTGAYRAIGDDTSFSLKKYRYEYGFTLLCRFLNHISRNPQLLIMVTSAFMMFAVGYATYRLSEDVALSAFMFIAMTTYTMYLNVMRQAVAIGFVLIGYCKLRDRKWPIALIFFLIATQFHQTAWLVLLVFPITLLTFTRTSLILYILTTIIMFICSNSVTSLIATILGRTEFYDPNHTESNYFGALIQLMFVISIVAMCFFYMPIQKLPQKQESDDERMVYTYQHMLMLWVMFVAMGVKVEVLGRLSYYFGALVIIIVPLVLKRVPAKESFFVRNIFCLVCFVYFVIIGVFRPQWHGAIPYATDFSSVINVFKTLFR